MDSLPEKPAGKATWLRRFGRLALLLAVALGWLWTGGALKYLANLPALLVWVVLAGLPILAWRVKGLRIAAATSAVLLFIWMAGVWLFFTKPSTLRRWWAGNSRPPIVRVDEAANTVWVDNVRHFKWRTREDFDPAWVTETFYLDQLDSLDLVIEPLGESKWFAHTMLSFGFGPERRVVISIEARREEGEKFGMVPGIYKQFELFYQVNSERDAFTLRTINENSHLYVYPVKASPEFIRELFLDMLDDAYQVVDHPQFYHSLRANCTTKLFEHVNRSLDEPISYTKEILFPAQAGALLHRLGWMATELDYPAARERFRLAEKVRKHAAVGDFSARIRE